MLYCEYDHHRTLRVSQCERYHHNEQPTQHCRYEYGVYEYVSPCSNSNLASGLYEASEEEADRQFLESAGVEL